MSRLERLEELHARDPADADVLYMLAQEHANRDEHARAVDWYDACLSADPSYHYAHFHKARSLEALGRAEQARAALAEGLERSEAAGDAKAAGELREYLESLEG